MSFSQFQNIPEVQKKYAIRYQENNFVALQPAPITKNFQTEFDFNLKHMAVFASEAARCEIIIFPILREVYKSYSAQLALWVQKSISLDAELTGTPDYLVSRKSDYGKLLLEYPLLVVVKAKKNDFEQGWGQCLAELIAVQKLNNDILLPVYGIVTDGKLWELGCLKQLMFTKNLNAFTSDHLPELFSALHFVFQQIET
jgi:hypothetical protein